MSQPTLPSYPLSALVPADLSVAGPEEMQNALLSSAILRSAEDAIFSTTLQGVVTSWNPAAARLFGYTVEQMIGKHTSLPFFPDRLKERGTLLDQLKRGEPIPPFASTQLDREGKAVSVLLTLFPIRNESEESVGLGVIARKQPQSLPDPASETTPREAASVSSDSATIHALLMETNAELVLQFQRANAQSEELAAQKAKLERANQRLEELNARLSGLANTDGLTGLKNHRTFQERLLEEVQRAQRYRSPLSLLMLDVDRFKIYNDAFGHPAGDGILRKIAESLQTTARTTDMVARYGGDEFAVILPETDQDQARIAAERFRAAIEIASWPEWAVTVSVGVSTHTRTATDALSLIEEADAALYQSKRIGRNCVTHFLDSLAAASESAPADITPTVNE